MMSTDFTPEEKENGSSPTIDVSGVPAEPYVFDMSSPALESSPENASENASEEPAPEKPAEAEPAVSITVPTAEIIGVRFKSNGKIYYFDPRGIKGKKGDHAIVETARGQEYGEVALENTRVPESEIVPPIRPMLRIATKEDDAHYLENKKKEEEAFATCLTKIEAHKLDMKLVEAQYTFDNNKLLFYFTSAGRVDFRDLVKDLASVFRTRIELRQIGIRDEAKLIGGLGSCGRTLCCAGFLTDFGQVSIKMAKEQNLSLNSAKISGTCGRLMCCLRYEYETYLEEIRLTPPVDSRVRTPDGTGTVTEISPMMGAVKVRLTADPDSPPRSYHRDTVTVLPRGKSDDEDEPSERPAKPEPTLSEKLSNLPDTEELREIPVRRAPANAERNARRDKGEQPTWHSRDEKRQAPKNGSKRTVEGGKAPRENGGAEDGAIAARNHSQARQNQHNRGKVGSHPRKQHTGKTQHRGGGNRSTSGGDRGGNS